MTLVYIGVGSNQGDRHENIQGSRRLLRDASVDVRRVSPLYETQALVVKREIPTGIPRAPSAAESDGQSPIRFLSPNPDFLNAVFESETALDPEALLDVLEDVERRLGRTSKGDWAPRPIDLDILLYGDRVVDTPRLKIPHPEMASRWFVLKPLADLAPDVVHPVMGKKIKDLLNHLVSPPNLPLR